MVSQTYTQAQLDAFLAGKATPAQITAAVAAKADLVGGVIPSAQLPSLSLVTAVPVASQAAMLALTTTQVQPGDLAVRSDGAGTFILTATDPTQLANWTRLNAPTDVVTSVNGQIGTVVLSAANVGADPAGAAAAVSLSLPVNTISANGTAVIGARNSINASAGPIAVTMPVPTAVGQHMIIERADASGTVANAITVTGTIRGVANSTVILAAVGAAFEGALYIAESLTSWAIAASIKPRAVLDAYYDAKGAASTAVAAQTDVQGRVSVVRHSSPFGDGVPVISWGVANVRGVLSNSQVGTGYTSRVAYKAAIAATDIRLVFPGWITSGSGEQALGNDVYYKCSIEYNGTFYPVTFGGLRKVTVNPWGVVISDPVSLELAKGDSFNVRTFYDTPAGGVYPRNVVVTGPPAYGTPVGGSLSGFGYTSGDVCDATSAMTTTNADAWPGPMTVLGSPLGATPKVLIGLGDSITYGQGEGAPFSYGSGGYLVRAVNDTMPLFITAIPGLRAGQITSKQVGHRMGSYWSLGTHASVMYGTNDLFLDNTVPATVQARLFTIWTMLANRGLKVNACTILPSTTSTDSWATTTNQAPKASEASRVTVNTWIRAGAPIDPTTKAVVAVGTAGALVAGQAGHPLWGYFETADGVESARNSGLWQASLTGDGTHPTSQGHTAIAAGMDITRLP